MINRRRFCPIICGVAGRGAKSIKMLMIWGGVNETLAHFAARDGKLGNLGRGMANSE